MIKTMGFFGRPRRRGAPRSGLCGWSICVGVFGTLRGKKDWYAGALDQRMGVIVARFASVAMQGGGGVVVLEGADALFDHFGRSSGKTHIGLPGGIWSVSRGGKMPPLICRRISRRVRRKAPRLIAFPVWRAS